jgi:hypothetical protein
MLPGGAMPYKAAYGRKNFCFEKKKQRTFAPAPSSPDVNAGKLQRRQTDKRFYFFFQK